MPINTLVARLVAFVKKEAGLLKIDRLYSAANADFHNTVSSAETKYHEVVVAAESELTKVEKEVTDLAHKEAAAAKRAATALEARINKLVNLGLLKQDVAVEIGKIGAALKAL